MPALQRALERLLGLRQLQRYIRAITARQGPTFLHLYLPIASVLPPRIIERWFRLRLIFTSLIRLPSTPLDLVSRPQWGASSLHLDTGACFRFPPAPMAPSCR